MTKTADLAYWISERYAMKERKDANIGPKLLHGYSADPNMGRVRYCNVHREDDKVTKWLAEHWRPAHASAWEIVLARMINYIPSLQQILVGWEQHPEEDPISRAFKDLWVERNQGKKIFTSAYTISTCGKSMDKLDYVRGVVQSVRREEESSGQRWPNKYSLYSFHDDLMQIDGLGSFLAAQVVADLKNTKHHALEEAPDWWTWAAPGPGSLKGLEEYFGYRVTPSFFESAINVAWADVKPLVTHVPPIHMQDFQNCLCEFSKYERVKRGGHARNKYHPG